MEGFPYTGVENPALKPLDKSHFFDTLTNSQSTLVIALEDLLLVESPQLSEVELMDLAESEQERKEGKGRKFKDSKSALKWLEEDRE
jgi:hypothetical protein